MKKIIASMAFCVVASVVMAQETYESAQIATTDLNGTAKYIGMGGAMEALGADISTISTNPAGIGVFRRSWMGVSAGFTSQQADKEGAIGINKSGVTNADFNQIGFVYATSISGKNGFNIAFNYHKDRNFNQIINAMNSLNDASASKASFIAFYNCNSASYMEEMNKELVLNPLGGYSSAKDYRSTTDNSGYISAFDFNFSGNIASKLFLGLTIGTKRVNYHNRYYYDENLVTIKNADRGTYSIEDYRDIRGTGFDIKFGAIFRPIAESPFRIGAYIHTPTWYSLTADIGMYGKVRMNDVPSRSDYGYRNKDYSYDYKIYTPWKFGASLAHTFGDFLALGLTYEYADYSAIRNKVTTGTYVETYWQPGYWEERSYNSYSRDADMDNNTDRSLKGVHTVKFGIELKPIQQVAIRLGYNFVSAMYKSNGEKDYNIDGKYSNGAYFSNLGYTNWGAVNRITFGLGFALSQKVMLDLSYQCALQKGDYHPFRTDIYIQTNKNNDGGYNYETNVGTPTSVKNNRHQMNVTLGYKF